MKPVSIFVAFSLVFSLNAWSGTASSSDAVPLSTKSAQVRRLLDRAWVLGSDQVEQPEAIEVMRKVVKLDPNFAMGHEILSRLSLDPAEQISEQKRAFANRSRANAAEQIVIDWFQNAADHQLIPAITNMNEALRQYPHDRWLVFLANSWLTAQTQYERAAEIYENSGIADSPGLINDAAYTYANMRQFSKAFSLMDKYVALLPQDANPQDSYAEILRMAGHYNVAIDHYQTALKLNPQFYSSQFGVADTYLLMGDEVRARQAYEAAFQKYPSLSAVEYVRWKTRWAATYVYEKDFAGADKVFQSLIDYSRAKHLSQAEAEAYRQMAMYQPRSQQALALLDKAETALHEGNNVSATDAQQESAQALRTRVEVNLRGGDYLAADSALAKLAELSLNSDDKIIESAFHAAVGAHLFYERKYKEAIPHLDEDHDNPLSLQRLATAYEKTGYASGARETQEILANFNDPTVEQAMVVPAFRRCLASPGCNVSVKNAAMEMKH